MLVSVALPLPLFRTFTYEVDDAQAARAQIGMRAVVPFRSRREVGVIVGPSEPPPSGIAPKRVLSLPDAEPVLGASVLALCRWMSEYYVVPLGLAVRSVLPSSMTRISWS